MKPFLPLTALGLVLFLFSGCTLFDKDLKTARDLEGNWDVTSFTEDGVEAMQVVISSFTIEFEEYDKGNDEGDFTFSIIYTGGGSQNLTGEYLVDEDGTNLELNYSTGGPPENWDIDLEKDDLEMTSVIGGVNYHIRAERD